MDNPVKDLIEGAIKNIEGLIDSKNIIGEPISAGDGTVIIPVSKVSVGFGGGGSEFDSKHASQDKSFGGGIGGGVKLNPEAFLVISNGNVRLISMNGGTSPLDKVIDLVPGMVDKVNDFINKRKTSEDTPTE